MSYFKILFLIKYSKVKCRFIVSLLSVYCRFNVVKLLLENSNSTAKEMSKELSLSERTIERILKSLQIKGVIERIGSKKMGRWKVIKFD